MKKISVSLISWISVRFIPCYFTLFFTFLILGVNSADGQTRPTENAMQVGFSGLPIFYLDNSAPKGLRGYAFYGNIGWYHSPNLVFGLRPFYGVVNDVWSDRMVSFGMNFYVRKYLTHQRWKLFLDANLGIGYLDYQSEYEIDPLSSFFPPVSTYSDYDGIMGNFAFGPGVDIAIKNGFHLEVLVQYLEMYNLNYLEETTTGRTVIPTIGIQKIIGK